MARRQGVCRQPLLQGSAHARHALAQPFLRACPQPWSSLAGRIVAHGAAHGHSEVAHDACQPHMLQGGANVAWQVSTTCGGVGRTPKAEGPACERALTELRSHQQALAWPAPHLRPAVSAGSPNGQRNAAKQQRHRRLDGAVLVAAAVDAVRCRHRGAACMRNTSEHAGAKQRRHGQPACSAATQPAGWRGPHPPSQLILFQGNNCSLSLTCIHNGVHRDTPHQRAPNALQPNLEGRQPGVGLQAAGGRGRLAGAPAAHAGVQHRLRGSSEERENTAPLHRLPQTLALAPPCATP